MPSPDWVDLLLPDASPLEVALRGSVVYLVLFAMLRLVLKREPGAIGLTDLLVVVLIADAVSGGLTANTDTVPDALLLAGTIIGWSFALEWMSVHMGPFARFVHPPPLPLVLDGAMIEENLRKGLISKDELMSRLREEGYEDLAQVKQVSVEGNGRISIVPKDGPTRAEA